MKNNRIRVLLADDNVDFCNSVLAHLSRQEDIEVIKTVHNGIDAYQQIKELNPDIAILDGAMPGLDGLGVLEKLNQEKSRPICIMLSTLRHDSITQYANSLGAEYYIIKPFELDTLANRIRMFGQPTPSAHQIDLKSAVTGVRPYGTHVAHAATINPDAKLEHHVSTILLDIGVPQHTKGNDYLRAAIVLAVREPEIVYYITKGLYPSVAKKCKTTSTSVERSIRNTIDVIWTRGNIDELKKHFGYTFNKRPTNGEFVAFIADNLRMEQLESATSFSSLNLF